MGCSCCRTYAPPGIERIIDGLIDFHLGIQRLGDYSKKLVEQVYDDSLNDSDWLNDNGFHLSFTPQVVILSRVYRDLIEAGRI